MHLGQTDKAAMFHTRHLNIPRELEDRDEELRAHQKKFGSRKKREYTAYAAGAVRNPANKTG